MDTVMDGTFSNRQTDLQTDTRSCAALIAVADLISFTGRLESAHLGIWAVFGVRMEIMMTV